MTDRTQLESEKICSPKYIYLKSGIHLVSRGLLLGFVCVVVVAPPYSLLSNPREPVMEPGAHLIIPKPTTSPTASPTATSVPTLLNKYQMGRLLGRGSFAKVHQARSIVDNTVVAIKIINKNANLDPNMEARIVREVSAMRRLHHHPNVVKIHEVMATKTKIYLVMELASGGELFSKVLRRGRLNEPSARHYFQQLVSALHFCHQNGVAHRDVKPQNLLLDKDGNLKISDFGLSALPEQLKNGLLHTACGTPAYTAPEVVARRGYDGAKADAWSCGVILYVLLAGYLPFDDSNLIAMYKKMQRREYQFPSWISRQARSIIFQLLDPNPKTRMSLEALMKLSWFKRSLQLKSEQESSLFESELVLGKDSKYDMVSGNAQMNAFDIISFSSGLDLSGLFEAKRKMEKRFTTVEKMERVVEKVRDLGERMGYRVERGKCGGVIGLGKQGKMVLVVQVLEISPEMLLVEMKVTDGCDSGAVEFEEVHWQDLLVGLEDIVLSWHKNDVIVM